jgi:hypothetical protein
MDGGYCQPRAKRAQYVAQFFLSRKEETRMSEQEQPQGGQQGGQGGGEQGIQLIVDERDSRTNYANAFRFHQTAEEIILDVGFNMPNPNPGQLPQGTQMQLLWKVTDRVIMNYPAAKRMLMQLTQLIKRYEQQFGEIPTQPQQRR